MAKIICMHAFMTSYGTYEMDGESRGGINFIGPAEEMGEQGGAKKKSEYGGKTEMECFKRYTYTL